MLLIVLLCGFTYLIDRMYYSNAGVPEDLIPEHTIFSKIYILPPPLPFADKYPCLHKSVCNTNRWWSPNPRTRYKSTRPTCAQDGSYVRFVRV